MTKNAKELGPHRLIRIAAAYADVDEATALRAALGLRTRNGAGERVVSELRKLGVEPAELASMWASRSGNL